MRKEGKIGDLKTGLGVDGEKREGGIPLPLPSFGVGGEFGTGGKYDNGERFDLRLPFVDQGWVDESDSLNSGGASWFSKLGSGGAKKPAAKKDTRGLEDLDAEMASYQAERSGPAEAPAAEPAAAAAGGLRGGR